VPPASSFRFKSSNPDVRRIARELSVRYLLAGAVRTGGARVHVTVQLLDGAANSVVWAESYDRLSAEAIDIETQIAAALPAQLGVKLAGFGVQDAERPANFDAYNAYLHGLYHLNRRQTPSLRLAQRYSEQANRRGPFHGDRAHRPKGWRRSHVGYVTQNQRSGTLAAPVVGFQRAIRARLGGWKCRIRVLPPEHPD